MEHSQCPGYNFKFLTESKENMTHFPGKNDQQMPTPDDPDVGIVRQGL